MSRPWQLAISPVDFKAHPNPISGFGGGIPSVGGGTSCAMTADGTGRVRCWGGGMLGDGTTTSNTTPQYVCINANCQNSITDQLDNVAQLSVGGSVVCAVRLGAAKCWGNNDKGQLGDGTTIMSLSPATSTAIPSNVASVSAGSSHVCALMKDGTVQCWGNDANGQLGDDDPAGLIKRTPVTPHW